VIAPSVPKVFLHLGIRAGKVPVRISWLVYYRKMLRPERQLGKFARGGGGIFTSVREGREVKARPEINVEEGGKIRTKLTIFIPCP